jgi:hypothetical protein
MIYILGNSPRSIPLAASFARQLSGDFETYTEYIEVESLESMDNFEI